MAKLKKKKRVEKKKRRIHLSSPIGTVHIKATFNNTIVTVADSSGKTVAWASGGLIGFKGTKKSTPYAAQKAASITAKKVKAMGMTDVSIMVKGPGPGRESAIRSFQNTGLNVKRIRDVTPIPHNGCRKGKSKRM
jgi:small subunit ribosomal protein S11